MSGKMFKLFFKCDDGANYARIRSPYEIVVQAALDNIPHQVVVHNAEMEVAHLKSCSQSIIDLNKERYEEDVQTLKDIITLMRSMQ